MADKEQIRQVAALREYLQFHDGHLTRAEGLWLLDELAAAQEDAKHLNAIDQQEEAHSPVGMLDCVGCDNCGFRYSAEHITSAGYICSACAEDRTVAERDKLLAENQRLRAEVAAYRKLPPVRAILEAIQRGREALDSGNYIEVNLADLKAALGLEVRRDAPGP